MNSAYRNSTASLNGQRGVVLIVALILLLILTLLGLAAAQSTSLEERMAGNSRDAELAFQAAEAGLRAAENCLNTGAAPCSGFNSDANGVYLFNPDAPPPPSNSSTPLWEVNNFWNTASNSIQYSTINSTPIPAVVSQPQIIIEQMPPVAMPGGNLSSGSYGSGSPSIQYYRITVRGTGGDTNATAIVQSMYQPN